VWPSTTKRKTIYNKAARRRQLNLKSYWTIQCNRMLKYNIFLFRWRHLTLLPLSGTRGTNIKATLFEPLMTHLGSDKLQATSSWRQVLHRMRTGTSIQEHQKVLHAAWLYRARRSQTTCHWSAVTSGFLNCICVESFYYTLNIPIHFTHKGINRNATKTTTTAVFYPCSSIPA
jgi:hypothetical protein